MSNTKPHVCPGCGRACEIHIHANKSALCQECSRHRSHHKTRSRKTGGGIAPATKALARNTLQRIEAIGKVDEAVKLGNLPLALAIADENGLTAIAAKLRRGLDNPPG